MKLGHPWALFLLLLIPILWGLFIASERRVRARSHKSVDVSLLASVAMVRPEVSRRLRALDALFMLLSMAALIFAMSGPQLGSRIETRKVPGFDAMVLLDFSRSMLAEDVLPNRFERAQQEIQAFVGALDGDRVGLVGFTSVAFPLTPPTIDHEALRARLFSLTPDDIPTQGTALAEGIASAVRLLSNSTAGSDKMLVIFTDGEDHGAGAADAAKEALSQGIEVHVVGVGGERGEPIPLPTRGYLKDAKGKAVVSRLDSEGLGVVAQAGGGELILLDSGSIAPILANVRTKKRVQQSLARIRIYEERYALAATIAFLFGLLSLLFSARGPKTARVPSVVTASFGAASVLVLLGAGPFSRADPFVEEGNAALAKGDLAAAEAAYQKAGATLESAPELWLNLGLLRARQERTKDADASLMRLYYHKGDPTLRHDALLALGNNALRAGRPDRARGFFRTLLMDDPSLEAARKNLEIAERLIELERQKEEQQIAQDEERQKTDQAGDGSGEAPSSDPRDEERDGGEEQSRPSQPSQKPPRERSPKDRSEPGEILKALDEAEPRLFQRQLLRKIGKKEVDRPW